MEIDIKGKSSEDFVKELWERIDRTGFNILPKNDIYDLLLHLFNKHNGHHFLDDNSNYENAVSLKITETRLKSARRNIALRYMETDERRKSLINYFLKISKGKTIITSKDDCFVFLLDDPAAQMELESILKKTQNTTLNYSENRERVTLEKVSFLKVLQDLTGSKETIFLENLRTELKKKQIIVEAKAKLIEVAKTISIEILPSIIKTLFNNVV